MIKTLELLQLLVEKTATVSVILTAISAENKATPVERAALEASVSMQTTVLELSEKINELNRA